MTLTKKNQVKRNYQTEDITFWNNGHSNIFATNGGWLIFKTGLLGKRVGSNKKGKYKLWLSIKKNIN